MGCFGFLGNTWCPVIPDTKHTLLQYPETNSVPPITRDLESACRHLYETGMCVVADVLTPEQTKAIGEKLEEQAASERALGDLAPKGMVGCKQYVPNMVNKGKSFLDLVEKRKRTISWVACWETIFCCQALTATYTPVPIANQNCCTVTKGRSLLQYRCRWYAIFCGL